MKIQGKATPKLVTKDGDDEHYSSSSRGLLAQNSVKGIGHFIGAALVGAAGYIAALSAMIGVLLIPVPLAFMYMDPDLGKGYGARKGSQGTTGSVSRVEC